MIDLTNLGPNEVSRDLKNYVIGIYGQSGSGKTTTASKFERGLIIDTELGAKALPGVFSQPVLSWVDFLTVIAQLRKKEVKERFDTIVIDTIGALVKHAEKYVLDKFGAENLNDSEKLPYGLGHTELERMVYSAFLAIQSQGYGLVINGHEKNIVDKDNDETFMDIDIANKRIKKYIIGMLDVMMYVEKTRNPNQPNIAYFKTTEKAEAKSRFHNIVDKVEFNYENVRDAIHNAIGDGGVDKGKENFFKEETYSKEEFEKLKNSCTAIGQSIIEENSDRAEEVVNIVQTILQKKISESSMQDVPLLKELEVELVSMKK